MARARNIKPALFRNEVLGVADPLHVAFPVALAALPTEKAVLRIALYASKPTLSRTAKG